MNDTQVKHKILFLNEIENYKRNIYDHTIFIFSLNVPSYFLTQIYNIIVYE